MPSDTTTKPELRHLMDHLMALRWTCPHDHGILRFEDGQSGVAPLRLVPGLYGCGVHHWRYQGGEWAEVGSRDEEVE